MDKGHCLDADPYFGIDPSSCCYITLQSMPMTNDSTIQDANREIHSKSMNSPRISTINLIRQFARAYVCVAGVGTLNSVILN